MGSAFLVNLIPIPGGIGKHYATRRLFRRPGEGGGMRKLPRSIFAGFLCVIYDKKLDGSFT